MLTRKRISTERLPPKKRMHRPHHLRKIPSAHIGGTVRVPLDAAPPLLHHPDSDDQLPLQAPAPSSPGVRALRLIHVPRVLVRLPPLPAQLPESSSIAQDYAMDETCFAETSSSMEVSPRGHRKEGNGPDIACKLEEGNLLYGLKKENNERSWENPRISCTIRPSSLQGRVMTSLEAISNSDVIARTRVEKNKLPTSDIERNLEAALSPVVLCLERQAALEMQVMPEILETFEGSGFKDRNPAEARMKQFPKDSHILEPGVRNAPGPRRLKSLEAGSVQGAAIHGKPVKDSLILAARAFATNARMRKAKDGSAPIARFEPENIGSYPPRPPNILLFKNALEYIIAFRDLNGLERVEDNDVVALAETEKEPEDYIAQQKFTMNKVQTRFNILLEFFDNPEVDRQHLSIELIMAHKSGKRGVHARSRFFITKSKSFIWAPCLIVDYIPDTDTFVVEWPENHALKNVKRINLILDTENENSFLIRRMNAKELQNRLEDSQRYLAYLEELAFVNPELVNKSLKYRLMQLAGWKISQRYMYVLDDYMKDLKEEYHLVVKKAICDYRFNTSKEEHNKLIAMKIFPQHGTVAPIPHIHNGLANFVYEIGYQFGKLGGPPLHLALSGSYIMAQVQDLAVASPATVSRCGMVYVEPSQIGWWPLITSWLRRMKENFPGIVAALPMIESLLTWLITPCIDFVKKHCRELIPTAAINLAQSLLNLYESMLDEFRIPTGTRASQRASQIGGIVLFTPPTGSDVDIWIQLLALEDDLGFELPAGQVIIKPKFKMALPYPEAGSVYNYCFWKLEQVWKDWIQTVDTRPPAMTAAYNDIIVPTVDTARYSFLLIVLVQHQKHVLFGGPTGTGNLGLFMDAGTSRHIAGKTVYIKDELSSTLDKNLYRTIMMTFSAQTNANQTQAIIDSKLDKRKRGVYGPYPEEKCVIFVDDLNMPALETYGAQPPIEILRQWMDHGGWYDREDNTFHQLINIQFVAAMGPPGGGHNSVTPRYMRHYNVLSILDFDNASLTVVFTIIVDWWARKTRFPHDALWWQLPSVSTEQSPSKSHYTYSMRDLSKVFQGMCMFAGVLDSKKTMVKLWSHECLRVFHDRLVNDEDRLWFFKYLKAKVEDEFSLTCNYVYGVPEDMESMNTTYKKLAYGDIMDMTEIPRKNIEISDHGRLLQVLEEGLAEFNAQTRSPMLLVLFTYAAQHVLRISRIIRQPFGNALLVGVGGGGRQSLTKLATFMAGYGIFQVEISKLYGILEWQEDLKVVLKKAGAENTPTVFIFSDTQLKLQQFLEDINNILNTGEVPNLYPKDEIVPLLDMIRTRAKKAGKDGSIAELYMYFIELCRTNLHMVMCMSPFGDNFRTRLRMFPSLVNCCTIDWFSEWPEEALRSVATNFVASIDIDKSLQEPVRDMCMLFHQHAATLAVTFLQEAQRFIYVTPTSYLELLATYKDLLQKKWKEIDSIRTRYKMGLEKLYFAESQVTVMKESLVALQPILIKTAEDTNMLLKAIDAETKDAQATCSIVETEEAAAHVKAMEAKAIKDECEGELAVAMPMLEAALAALDTLTKADITEVKAMKNPPATVKLVMEACCIMKGVKSRRIPDPNKPGSKMEDFWGPTQQMLADSGFLTSLKTYDKDNMPAALMEKIHPYISNPNFEPAVVLKASKAAYGLCCWVRAMESYDKVNKAKLAAATMEFEGLQAALALKKEFLKAIEDKLAGLQEQLDKKGEEKAALEREVLNCKNKLARASQLINGLGGEKVRWTKVQADMSVVYQNLLGDVLLSSGYIAYLGAVNLGYRQTALKHWEKVCREKNVPCSDDFSLANVLGNPVTIRNWVIDGLPNDSFSVDNAIIMSVARRWPLLIDPQGQANNWIRNKEKKFNLQTMKLSDSDFVRKLESCIQFGFPLLLENVLEELDPTLEPLLIKAIFKSGGSLQIRLGDNTIEYNKKFRFYITTKLRNPHYFPEVAVKVTLLNFMITPEGLEDQLLGEVVKHERPDLEEEKTQLVIRGAENARQLSETEDQIILVLSSAEGNILEDETAINNISSSKALSVEIAEKQKTAVVTEAKIDVAHQGYIPVAKHVSALFFMISELCNVDPMYQYSLSWYLQLFISGMEASNKSADLDTRISTLNDFFTYLLYCNVARSLFQKDKLLLTFSICITNLRGQGKLDIEEWNFLLSGAGLERSFTEDASSWSHFYASQEPYYEDLPAEWAEKLSNFQMLLVVRVLRPDKLVGAVSGFLLDAMGQRYVEPPGFDLTSAYGDSDALTPLIFILSAGSDPMAALLKFSEEGKHVVNTISLGQGQGPKAALLIQSALRTGDWVVLQNCHLAPSWMPSLERICENFTPEGTNISFRLWLTSYPSDQFPVAILQNGVKMTNEAPKGLRANMLQSYLTYPISDPEFFHMGGEMGVSWRKMVFGLCFFHASVQERVKFGPLGWNIPYQFSDPDLKISLRQLQSFLLEFPDSVPFKAFVYLTGECNYGGRVTDAHDRRTLVSILSVIYQPNILHDSYSLSNSGAYLVPKDCEYQDYIEHIKRFPLIAMPEAFGLHQNADITKDNQEVNQPLTAILSTQSQSRIAGGRSREELLLDIVMDMNKRLPPPFNLELARYKYPVQYEESMNSVLVQEMVRFNCLTDVIRASLATLQKALKGLVVMSSDIETLAKNMFTSKMPVLWAPVSYPTMKPLSSYFNDLMDRLNMLQSWMDNGPTPIDTICFEFICLPEQGDHEKRPEDGVYIYGMFLEGARWDNEHMMLAESFDKVLHSNAPMLWLLPTEMSKKIVQACYMCPLYRTTERRGVLATTGHSSNFVFNVELPTKASPDHWICRGVAMLLSLSD
ncbi:unnamed protein product [Sphagnum tenellum]